MIIAISIVSTVRIARMAELWNDARLRNMVEFRVEVDYKGCGTMWLEEISSDLPLELELELGEFLYNSERL